MDYQTKETAITALHADGWRYEGISDGWNQVTPSGRVRRTEVEMLTASSAALDAKGITYDPADLEASLPSLQRGCASVETDAWALEQR